MNWLFTSCISLFSVVAVYAQQDNAPITSQLVNKFNTQFSPQIKLYNGPSYKGYAGKLVGSPYMGEKPDYTLGSVVYDGFEFQSVPLLYDMVKEKLVSLLPTGYTEFSLISDKVSSFRIFDRNFVNFVPSDTTLVSGFYELTYNGLLKVLVKERKQMQEIVDTYGVRKNFSLSTSYFILTSAGQLHQVNSERSFLKLFPAEKSRLKKYAKEQGLNFKKAPINTLNELSKFYDGLSK